MKKSRLFLTCVAVGWLATLVLWLISGYSLVMSMKASSLLLTYLSASLVLVTLSFLLGLICVGGRKGLPESSSDNGREIIADLSHDIRTPLTSVRGYIETLLLKGDGCPSDERQEYLEIVMKNLIQLTRLVEELFQFAKVQDDVRSRKFEPIEVCELVSSVVVKFRPFAEDKGVTILFESPQDECRIMGDRVMLERALSNIVNNAVYYTDLDGRIDVSAARNNKKIIISVKDTGIGIPKADQDLIFDRFYRVNKDRSRETGGTGLGLAISKTVLEAHRGSIRIESTLGVGTEVIVELPVS